jgi:hypothetical protein
MPQASGLEIRQASPGIEKLVGQGIIGHAVDGEISTPSGIDQRQVGIGIVNGASTVAGGSRQGDIHHSQLEDAKLPPHQPSFAQLPHQELKAVRRNAIHFDIDVFAGNSQEGVANISPHKHCPASHTRGGPTEEIGFDGERGDEGAKRTSLWRRKTHRRHGITFPHRQRR